MRAVGYLLAVAGAALILAGWLLSPAASPDDLRAAGLLGEMRNPVANLHQLATKANLIATGGFSLIAGVLLLGFERVVEGLRARTGSTVPAAAQMTEPSAHRPRLPVEQESMVKHRGRNIWYSPSGAARVDGKHFATIQEAKVYLDDKLPGVAPD